MSADLSGTARAIRESLAGTNTPRGEAEAIRLAFSFVEIYEKAEPATRTGLVGTRPDSTGDRRFDALLAAVAEHLSAADFTPAPAWAGEPDRFLDEWWFVAGLRSMEAEALVHSPISFARRGIFVTADALTYA